MAIPQESDFEIRIRPNQSWLRIDLGAIWEFRDLLALLVRRDFVARYQQTVLGPAWAIVQPLVMTCLRWSSESSPAFLPMVCLRFYFISAAC